MSTRKILVAIGLFTVAATAQAGWAAALPESTSVTLVFAALGMIAFGLRPHASTVAVAVEA